MRRQNLFWGAFLILIGLVFTLNNFGILRISIWEFIWPSFLIALGIWTIVATRPRKGNGSIEQVAIPLQGATKSRVRIKYGGGRMNLRGRSELGDLIQGGFGGGLNHKIRQENDVFEVVMSPQAPNTLAVFIPWAWGPRDWDFSLTGEIPVSLDVQTGGSDTRLNLTDLLVSSLKVQMGAGTTDLHLPANAGHTRVILKGDATLINVRVPEGVAARIRATGGLNSTTIDRTRFPKIDDVYQSEDYETAKNKVEIESEIGVGTLDIR